MSILEEIFAHKQGEVAAAREHISEEQLADQANRMTPQADFESALKDSSRPAPRLIAEIKFKSPSKGVLSEDFNPDFLAGIYADNGAAAISVLTDEKFFGGSLDTLKSIHDRGLSLPLLRKDFIFDRYQLLQARIAGASAVLLIAAMLDDTRLNYLISECHQLSLASLVEVHDETELERVLSTEAKVIGINNRDLNDFSVNLDTSLRLAKLCPPEKILVAESGIKSIEDIHKLAEAGFDAILVGEALMTTQDVAAKVRSLSGSRAA